MWYYYRDRFMDYLKGSLCLNYTQKLAVGRYSYLVQSKFKQVLEKVKNKELTKFLKKAGKLQFQITPPESDVQGVAMTTTEM